MWIVPKVLITDAKGRKCVPARPVEVDEKFGARVIAAGIATERIKDKKKK
jgi:hypothetical protein